VNHENRIIWVDDEHDLEKLTAAGRTPDQVTLFALNPGKRRTGAANNFFSVFRRDAMPLNMLFVPFVPSKLQEASRPS
jgi:hypothetical protein